MNNTYEITFFVWRSEVVFDRITFIREGRNKEEAVGKIVLANKDYWIKIVDIKENDNEPL